jgi:protein-S-isoprenylcysteine O-methyltransferase Ste14
MKEFLRVLLAVTAYGALHSLMAAAGFKAWLTRRLGVRLMRAYRLLYNAVGLVAFLPVLGVLARYPGETLYRLPAPWWILALVLQAFAGILLVVGLLQTDVWHFLGLRQLSAGEGGQAPVLVVRGLYRYMRHPLYSAGMLFLWATPWMTTGLLAFNLAITLYFYLGSLHEERRLLAEFGEAYRRYQGTVPRFLPRLRLKQEPSALR